MQGYIKLYRKTLGSSIFQDPYYFKLWMYCLMKASHKQHEQIVGNQMIQLEPGQFVTGRQALAEDMNKGMKPKQRQSELTWWRHLNNLEKWQMLNINKTNKYSVISIVNWCQYQESEQEMNNKRTSNEQQLNTNKNVKNEENEKSGRKYTFDDIHFGLAEFFYNQILNNNPEHKKPNLEKWANDIRLMMEQDKRNEEQIRYLIEWVQKDEFEMTNVLSPSKLRKRFDQLVMKVKQAKGIKVAEQPKKPQKSKAQLEQQRMMEEARRRRNE